jgi:DNA adenine methylase
MTMPRILHYPGSKWSSAEWIISHFPDRYEDYTYLSPFFGSGADLFRKKPSRLETVNDLDGDVTNLFRIIRDRPDELAHVVFFTPHSREEYYASYDSGGADDLERARMFLVRTWQAIGAKSSDRTGWRSVIQYEKAPHKAAIHQWNEVSDKIMVVTDRLRGIQIENQHAVRLLERYRHQDVLVYCDPPYLLSTRSSRIYKHEMTDGDHVELLETLKLHPGPVIISGYAHSLYDDTLKGWKREEKQFYAESKRPRIEVIWINPVAANMANAAERQLKLF